MALGLLLPDEEEERKKTKLGIVFPKQKQSGLGLDLSDVQPPPLTRKRPSGATGSFDENVLMSGLRRLVELEKGVSSGVAGSLGAMAGSVPALEASFGIDTPVGRVSGKAAQFLQGIAQELQPDDPNFVDQLASGAGSMALFLLPGMAIAKGAAALPRLGAVAAKIAPTIATTLPTVLESATEAGQTFLEGAKDKKVGRAQAAKNAQKVFFSNLIVVGLTNRLGWGSKEVKRVKKFLKSAPLEGIQEGFQEIIQAMAQGDEVNWDQVLTATGVGSIIGGGVSQLDVTGTRARKAQEPGLGLKLPETAATIPAGQPRIAPVEPGTPEATTIPQEPLKPQTKPITAFEVSQQQGSPSDLFIFPEDSRVEEFKTFEFKGEKVHSPEKVESEVKREYITRDMGLWKKDFVEEVKRREDGKTLAETPTVFIDFDNLKALNAKVGRTKANKLFRAFADLLNQHGFTAARWGGDEFVITINPTQKGSENPIDFFKRLQAFQNDLAQLELKDSDSAKVLHKGLNISAGFGIDMASADAAAEVAKAEGKNRIILDKKFVEEYNEAEGTNYEWTDKGIRLTARPGKAVSEPGGPSRGLVGQEPTGVPQFPGPARPDQPDQRVEAEPVAPLPDKGDVVPVPGPSENISDIQPSAVKFTEATDIPLKAQDLKSDPNPSTRKEVDQFFQKEGVRESRQKEEKQRLVSREAENIQNEADAISLLQRESGKSLATSPIFQKDFMRKRVAQLRGDLKKFIEERVPKSQQSPLLNQLKTASTIQSLRPVIQKAQEVSEQQFQVHQTEKTKRTIERTTGVKPVQSQVTVKEDIALRDQIRLEAKAAKEGFKAGEKEGSKFTKEEMLERFRQGRQQIQDTIDFIKNSLPLEERGRFISAATKATNIRKHYSIFSRVVERLEQIKAGELRADVKDFIKPSEKIPVDYQKRLQEMREGIDLSKPSELTTTKLKGLREFIAKNGEPLGINPKKVEALKRLTKKSVRDMSTKELTELRDELKKLQDLGELKLKLRWKYNVREWKLATKKLVDSTVKLDPLITGKEKVDKAKAEALKAYMETMHTMRVADMLDGYQNYRGENVRHMKDLAQSEDNSVIETRNRLANFAKLGNDLKSDFTQEDLEAMTFHILKEQKAYEQAQTLVDAKGWKSEPILTDKMRKMMDLLRKSVGEKRNQIEAVYEEIENKIFVPVENYFPLKYEKEFNLVGSATIEQTRFRTTQTFKGFTYGRKPKVKKVPRTDLFNILEEAISEQEWYINMQPKLENLKYLVKSEDYGNAAGQVGQNFWKNVLDVVSRRGWSATAQSNFFIREGRINLQKAILGYKLSSIFMQPMAIFDAMAWTTARRGPKMAAEVLKEFSKSWLNPKYAMQFVRRSPALQARGGGEEAIAETFESAKRTSQFYRVYIERGMGALQKADLITAAGVQRGVYNTLKKNGVPEQEALAESEFIMNLVSGSNNVVYRPHILSKGEGHRAWFTFQNFFMNRWGVIAHDLIKSGLIKGNYKQKISAAVGLGILMAGNVVEDEARKNIYEFVSGKRFKTESTFATALMTVPTAIPFFGNIIQTAYWSAKGGRAGSGPPIVRVFEDGIRGAMKALTSKKKSSRIKGTLKAIEAPLTLGFGVPGTSQAFDILERVLAQ